MYAVWSSTVLPLSCLLLCIASKLAGEKKAYYTVETDKFDLKYFWLAPITPIKKVTTLKLPLAVNQPTAD